MNNQNSFYKLALRSSESHLHFLYTSIRN